MPRVVRKHNFTDDSFLIEVEMPSIAQEAQPGHYVEVRVEAGETPLTLPLAGYDREKGTITVVHKALDPPSERLMILGEGDEVFHISGPLGAACKIDELGKVVLVAEDLGVASLYCRARTYKEKGSYTICVLGFETRAEIYWEAEFSALSDELYVCTQDGSYGVSGRITGPVRAVCDTHKDIERIIMIGQLAKMKSVAQVASSYDIPAFMSFDAIRQPVGSPDIFSAGVNPQETFAFAKAPEIDANEIDFDKLLAKQRALLRESEKSPAE
jgi:ferredoxin--NADP+ reductase